MSGRGRICSTTRTRRLFKLKNREFTFDVDVSNMPCGINGALYFVEMSADGGKSEFPTNEAGAKYGTGYCDAQCPHDMKWIDGEANLLDWDTKTGMGKYGICCAEMDIWEANKMAQAYTAHVCDTAGPTRCSGVDCGDNDGHRYDGHCDKDGCDFNPYRLGDKTFFGEGSNFNIDTSKPVTVVTQFVTSDNTDTGDLVEIRRKWVQDGKVIDNPQVSVQNEQHNSLTDDFCTKSKDLFGDTNAFAKRGGMKAMGEVLDRGMVLVMSLWDDHAANMLWLDSSYPTDKDPSAPGVTRGSCSPTSGKPEDVEKNVPNSDVVYSNIKVGTIGSTYPGGVSPSPSPPSPSPPSPSGCPGGSLSTCMNLCPSDPAIAYEVCVDTCVKRCTSGPLVV